MVTPMARLAERESSSTSGGAVGLLRHGSQTLPLIVPPSTLWECLVLILNIMPSSLKENWLV